MLLSMPDAMKSNASSQLSILVLVLTIGLNSTVFAQHNAAVSDAKFNVNKLMLGDKDISESLSVVNISKSIWTEFDPSGKEIGRATITRNKDNEVHIKWISATNGAEKDHVTIYKIKKDGNKYTFDIYFDDKKQGYFIATSE
ncbi:hypothetical protein [Fulvivirga lutimaris]|uniref:hypothetical protein n=1 Tax=Fulvivirga lutimaris TaxID=1819566 RepID=UPI0012BD24CF|nr:hypothetical protein [Fulvivirga lutimaris]MTI40208.1 hypothetical protein [Fulvivirga lutimaris]